MSKKVPSLDSLVSALDACLRQEDSIERHLTRNRYERDLYADAVAKNQAELDEAKVKSANARLAIRQAVKDGA